MDIFMLPEFAQLLIFITAGLALNLTPGVDMMYCLGQGLRSGPPAGIAASFGIATGGLIHTLLAAFGLAALLAAYPLAFDIVRYAGVAYLVWLAIQSFRSSIVATSNQNLEKQSAYRAWRDGVFVNLLNPKVAIFILAFVPQFVDADKGSEIIQFLLLGIIFNISGTFVNAIVGGFSGSIGKLLMTNSKLAKAFQWTSGAIFLGLAVKLALDRK
jgi:threonine/homoserine/homoserine lactone efflux protein